MKSIALGWRAVLSLAAVASFIGCDQSPTSSDRVPVPRFSISPGGGTWTTKAPMPTARSGLANSVSVVNGVLYAVGGGNNFGLFATVEAYNPATDTWTTKASMPTARANLGVGVVNGILYAVGGDGPSGCCLATVEAYDPATDTWTTKASMPTARDGMGVGVVNGILYAVGGTVGSSVLATVETYNPSTDTWTTQASLPTARGLLGAATINGILYAVGGVGGATTVEAYDPTTNSWTTKTSMPTARWTLGIGVVNGILYAVGGGTSADPDQATVEGYDPVTDTWTTTASMPTARSNLGVGVISGILYGVGGQNAAANGMGLATNEAFTPPFNFTGFFQPVDNPPVVNSTKAGSAIPVKFSLHGTQGLAIFALGYPGSQSQTCSGGVTDAIEQTVTANASGLTYDPVSDQYTYVWKTSKSWAGTCRVLSLGFTDGSVHQALFRFN